MGHRGQVAILNQVIEENTDRPFEWGVFDCCLFPAICLDAMHGTDFEAQLKAKYSNKTEALRWIAEAGGIGNIVPQFIENEIKRTYVTDGDVCLIQHDAGESLAIFYKGNAYSTGENGTVRVNRSAIIKGWRV